MGRGILKLLKGETFRYLIFGVLTVLVNSCLLFPIR